MICSKCGASMPDDSTFCPQCGAAVTPAAAEEVKGAGTEPTAEPIGEAASSFAETLSQTGAPQAGAQIPSGEPYVYSQPTQQIPPQYAYNAPQQGFNGAQQPPNGAKLINGTTYLVFAILITVMCCLPFGIPAIIYATKIDKLQAIGDFVGAQAAAKSSKMWSIIGGISLVLLVIVYIVLMVLGFAAAGFSGDIMY